MSIEDRDKSPDLDVFAPNVRPLALPVDIDFASMQLAEILNDGVLIVDPAGVTTYANSSALELLASSDEIVGMFALEQLGQKLDAAHPSILVDHSVAQRFRQPNGTVLYVTEHAWQIDVSGEWTVLLLAPEHRIAKPLATELDHLLMSIAHDLKNMLQGVNSIAALLDLPGGSIPDFLGKALQQASDHGLGIVKRLEAHTHHTPSPAPRTDAAVVVQGIEHFLRCIVDTSIDITYDIERGPVWVAVSVAELEEIVVNLVANAAEATEGSGRIHIRLHTQANDAGGMAQLAISDTGRGISHAMRSRIFERDFTTNSIGEGRGIGLATVASIVKNVNGFVRVAPEDRVGTCIAVYLPVLETK